MSADLSTVSMEELKERLTKAEAVHAQEPCRVGMYAGALKEVIRMREARADLYDCLNGTACNDGFGAVVTVLRRFLIATTAEGVARFKELVDEVHREKGGSR